MKKIILLSIITILSTIGQAQVRKYQQTQEQLLTGLQTGELSQEAYVSMTNYQLSGLKDSVQVQIQKPHYNACLDLAVIGGGVMYQKFGKNVKYDYILHMWGGGILRQRQCVTEWTGWDSIKPLRPLFHHLLPLRYA